MISTEDIEKTFQKLSRLPAISETLAILQNKLPSDLRYHSFTHTLEVLRDVIEFALTDKLSDRSIELLALAAVTHDVGFIQSRVDNEEIGAKYARDVMMKVGSYSHEEIRLVERMILDTALMRVDGALKQIPHTELSKYLLDADLGNFGRDDFFHKSDLQREELGEDVIPFRVKTLELLSAHRWLTSAAITTRQRKKEENVAKLKALIELDS
jgi:predicted metal-dependent HD superfamily phosphohydrolase